MTGPKTVVPGQGEISNTAAVLSSIDCDADRMTVLVHDVVVSNAEVVR